MYSLYYSIIARKLGLAKITDWGIAIRKCNPKQDTILGSSEKIQFNIIENTTKYWFADPLLFSDNGKTWLFVEAFNKETKKGEIGYFEIIDGQAANFKKIIETPTHMSYPFVFKHKNEYYMIPETGAAKEIVLYKAKSFPDDWIRDKVLLSGEVYRDSTVYKDNLGNIKLLTYRQEGRHRYDVKYYLEVFDLDMKNVELKKISEKYDKHKINRPAGHILDFKEHSYRPAQKCSRVYGESIYIYEFDDYNFPLSGKLINELRGKDIELNKGGKIVTIHTYSQAGGYEVIDYRCEK